MLCLKGPLNMTKTVSHVLLKFSIMLIVQLCYDYNLFRRQFVIHLFVVVFFSNSHSSPHLFPVPCIYSHDHYFIGTVTHQASSGVLLYLDAFLSISSHLNGSQGAESQHLGTNREQPRRAETSIAPKEGTSLCFHRSDFSPKEFLAAPARQEFEQCL